MATISYPFASSAVNSLLLLPEASPRPAVRPSFLSSRNTSKIDPFRCCRLRLSQSPKPKVVARAKAVSCSVDDDLKLSSDSDSSSSSDKLLQSDAASIDLKLPRRTLLVQFTCNECGERTQRLINRMAYEKGTVFVQCAGCLQHHKLVDNLGLVVEYDLQEEASRDEDQVPPVPFS
uniref:DNL-type domain-containing protein n=1 Tax=Kalanchoe fedtschenkoi TaxID=63787 RepID=A0A7N0U1N6_KALFE